MAEHLTSLSLDAVAIGQAGPEELAHVSGCAECQGRLAGLEAARRAFEKRPEAQRELERLRHELNGPQSAIRTRRTVLVAAALPLAAALVLFWVFPQKPPSGLKGTASLVVLDSEGQVVSHASPGQQVRLAVGGDGNTHAAVLAVDASGTVSQVWPPAGATAGVIGTGARWSLEPPFEVTPGDLTLVAFFSDTPVPVGPLQQALRERVETARRAGLTPLEVSPPPGAVARRLVVQ